MKVDGNKIQELKDHYMKKADQDIRLAKDKNPEMSDEEVTIIQDKYNREAEHSIQKILALSPEKMFKLGFSFESEGWRSGYTKSTVKKRAERRHKQNKAARKQRRKNNK